LNFKTPPPSALLGQTLQGSSKPLRLIPLFGGTFSGRYSDRIPALVRERKENTIKSPRREERRAHVLKGVEAALSRPARPRDLPQPSTPVIGMVEWEAVESSRWKPPSLDFYVIPTKIESEVNINTKMN
jgi:hypothetical protein